ncbi:CPBP family glutamic-type intramembrane protease [Cellulomonas sp. 179-A 4D5 NHS]|uniref:CPBP family glutamic-type intramembrane protease n=1 Tax=Cellulomonas sp. 179-A 4D5 NHS TaxID=3142378 RepID=UPI0039A28B12
MTATAVLEPPPPTAERGGAVGLVRRRPLLSFFVLANLASWIAWLPYILSRHGLGVWDFEFPGGSGGGQLLGMLPGAYLGPIGAALLVTVLCDGRAGLRTWARRLWRWRVGWWWYAGILLGVPAAMILSLMVFTGGVVHAPSATVLVAFVPGLLMQMVTTGLAEEPGWRDFALPRAQRRFGPLPAVVLVGVLWGVWHLPLYLTEWGGGPGVPWYRPAGLVVFCVVFNVVMTWVFNSTHESLPMAMLLHVSVNNFASVAGADMFPTVDRDTFQHALILGSVVVGGALVAATRGRLAYRGGQAPLS